MKGHTIGLTGEITIPDWLQLIRAEYAEVPGPASDETAGSGSVGLDPWVCDPLLKALVDAEVLRLTRHGESVWVR
jgi:hypothetical protein